MAPSNPHKFINRIVHSIPYCLLSALLIGGVFGCAHFAGEDLRTKNLRSIVTHPATTPEELALRGWAGFMLDSNWDNAIKDLTDASRLPPRENNHKASRQISLLGKGLILVLSAKFRDATEIFMDAIEIDPYTPAALVAVRQLAEVAFQIDGGHIRITSRIAKVLGSITTSGRSSGSVVFMVRALKKILRDAARRQGDWIRVKDIESSMGLVPVWRAVGPFGKHPLASMDVSMEPEKKPVDSIHLSEGVFTWILWPSELFISTSVPGGTGIFYAESFFHLDKPESLMVRIKSKSPWILFVDDEKIAVHDSQFHHLPEVDMTAIEAHKGWHRLLLKVATWKPEDTIGVELTNSKGTTDDITWWKWSDKSPDYVRKESVAVISPVITPRQILAGKLEDNPYDSISSVMAAMLFWDAGDTQKAEKFLDKALDITPTFAFARYLMALVFVDDSNIPPGIDKARAREILKSLAGSHPEFYLAKFRRALLLADNQERNKSLTILDMLEKKRPDCALWQNYTGMIQRKAGRTQEARLSLLKALHNLPDDKNLLKTLLDLAQLRSAFSDQTLYAEKLESLGEDAIDVAELWRRQGKINRAITVLENELRYNPGNIQARLQLSEILQENGQVQNAVDLLEKTRRLLPYEVAVSLRLSDALDRVGKHQKAGLIIDELSRIDPWHLGLRKVYAAKRGFRRINIAGDQPVDGLDVIRRFQAENKSYTGDSLLILDSAALEIAPNGSYIVRVHTIAQVLSPDGVERWGEISSIPASAQIELIRTISKEGETFDAEVIPGKQSITLQALQVGAFVEFQYVNTSPPAGPTVNAWLGNTFLMAIPGIPILKSIYSVAVPKGKKLSVALSNNAPGPRISHLKNHDVYTFELLDGPSIPIEVHAPITREVVPTIRAAFGVTWRDIRDGLRSNLLYYSRSTNELERFVQHTVSHQEKLQGIRTLFRKICSDIRQTTTPSSFYQPASYTLALKEGNRLLLLYASLKALGYEPRLLLARTIADPQALQKVPSGDDFAYGLIALDIKINGKNKTVWMDPSSKFSPFDEIFPFLAGMQALDVTATDPKNLFTRLPVNHTPELMKNIRLELKLTPDGTVEGTGHETITTWQSVSYREALHAMNKPLQKQALEAGLAGTFSGAILENFEFVGLDNPDRPLEIEYKFRAPAWARRRGDTLKLQGGIYPYELGRNLITYNVRKTPLLLADRTNTITHVSIMLPTGATIERNLHKSLTTANASFHFRLAQKDSLMTIDKRLVVEAGRISPANYPKFKNFCHQVDNTDTAPISVKMKTVAD